MIRLLFFIMFFFFIAFISWLWVTSIDNMKKKHPDYKGEDFLNNDNEKKY